MVFVKIVVSVVVEQKDALLVTEGLQDALDEFVRRNVPIFDSDLITSLIDDVDNAEEIQREIYGPRIKA